MKCIRVLPTRFVTTIALAWVVGNAICTGPVSMRLVPDVAAQQLKLIVAGDGRSDPKATPTPRPEDRDGINTVITAEIRDAVLKEDGKALLWTGDLVLGDRRSGAGYRAQLDAWAKLMQPLWDHHVKVLVVRGNHEASSADSVSGWNAVFSGSRALPPTGPVDATNLSYWVTMENVLILGIDQYSFDDELSPTRWIKETLATHKQQHIFAFGHEMAFMSGHHTDNLSVNAKNRNDLINALIGAGSQAFFAGHDHFYDHLVATPIVKNGQARSIHQFVAGTAGAPFYEDEGHRKTKYAGWKTKRVKHLPETNDDPIVYGYILVEIDGPKATITFKGRTAPGQYEPMDVWSYEAK